MTLLKSNPHMTGKLRWLRFPSATMGLSFQLPEKLKFAKARATA
jgi:hypothetical protein